MTKIPTLTLVGAGPGDPDLISVKGVKALQKADIVLYDALVSTELLNYAPVNVQKIFVGKRAGIYTTPQTDINTMIVAYAKQYGNVVRLKGGDPFVFGRGHEEIDFAKAAGLATVVIPGMSSITAIPTSLGFPLTKRGINESFWVVTGTTRTEELSKDLYLAIQASSTIVILMGLSKITDIVRVFTSAKKEHTPIAVIQEGTLATQKIAISTIAEIEKTIQVREISTPAIMIIGEVVNQHPDAWVNKISTQMWIDACNSGCSGMTCDF
jgi:uroporphyrin-III C-methyltransferase